MWRRIRGGLVCWPFHGTATEKPTRVWRGLLFVPRELFRLRGQGWIGQLDFGFGRGRIASGRSGVGCSGRGWFARQTVRLGEAILRGLNGVLRAILEFKRELVL